MKMWSGRFRQPLDPDFERWQKSFDFDRRLLRYEIAASEAHARALRDAEILSADELTPIFVFVAIVAGTFWVLSLISNRNSQAEERLERIGRPKSLVEIELSQNDNGGRFKGLKDAFSNLGGVMEPQNELEKNSVRLKLA